MKETDVIKEFSKICRTDEDRINLSASMLGVSGQLSAYLIDKCGVEALHKSEVSYALVITCLNLMAIESGIQGSLVTKIDWSNLQLPTREKLIKILRLIIEEYKEELK